MHPLQATWNPDTRRVFLWAAAGDLTDAIHEALPGLPEAARSTVDRTVVWPGTPLRRKHIPAIEPALTDWLPILASVWRDPNASHSLRCWSASARLALEIAARQAVAPIVHEHEARWQVLLSRRTDRDRYGDLVRALPLAARAVPTGERGPIRLRTPEVVVRQFLDATADAIYRHGGYPGPTRGWVLELADALRSPNSSFRPRDARNQGMPDRLSAWSSNINDGDLRLGVTLGLPEGTSNRFPLTLWMRPTDTSSDVRVPLDKVWSAGTALTVAERSYPQPAYSVMRDLARAQRIFPPIGAVLRYTRPRSLTLTPDHTWQLLSEGRKRLEDAGFTIELPESFHNSRRIQARMRIEADDGGINLGEMLRYRWVVTLGDRELSGAEFETICASGAPIVPYQGEWIVIDPAELKKLPSDTLRGGTLDAAAALRAVLTGQHEGVPVITDDRLSVVVDALRAPPDLPTPPELKTTLRPYQIKGWSWLSCLGDMGLGCCLADDMGLGKTVQVIAHLIDRRRRRPADPFLVVCPTSLLGNWTREIERFAPHLTVARYHGLHRNLRRARQADVVLTTYGLLARDIKDLSAQSWDVAVLDEAQAIKNPDSRRAQAAGQLTARHRIAMSGTPVENRLDEMWSIMNFLIPGLLGSRGHFRQHIAAPIEKFGDEDVAWRLKLGVSPFLLRRVKSDPAIVQDLPDKVERSEFCALTPEQASLYREVAQEGLARIAETNAMERRGHVLKMLTHLKQVCNHPSQYLKDDGPLSKRSGKLERTVQLIEQITSMDERVILFTQYRQMGWRIAAHLADVFGFEAPFLHGGVLSHERDAMVNAFQDDPNAAPVLLISLKAGGTGLNLTRATHVIHYDRWWNPAVEDQATDRAYRIGQHRNVQVHKFVCQGTLEERIAKLLEDKRSLANSVVGSGERLVTELDDDALRALVALGEDAIMEDE